MLKNIKKLRIDKGLSQQQLADIIGVSQQSINKYENHNVEPNIETLSLLADYFETSVDFIIGRTEINRKIQEVEIYALNEEEKKVIDSFRQLDKSDREIILSLSKRLIGK
ncbi:MAG: helix-turn-helix transcriptional regulator [Ruminococcaceae bacterium]|nr:helix-turn-helix transcriptional regulator [Oscillospiraceae bacterium]